MEEFIQILEGGFVMEDERYFEIGKYDILDYYDRLLTQYFSALYSVGLDREDYKEIDKIVRELDKIRSQAHFNYSDYVRLNKHLLSEGDTAFYKNLKTEYINIRDSRKKYLEEVENIRGYFEKILELIRANIKPSTIEDYLQEEVSITHLVFTNNIHPKIRLYSNDSFMFLCQNHIEKNPSLGVSNYRGYGMCFGCGWTFRVLDYLKYIEKLSDWEATSLLSRVYMIDIKDNMIDENHELVQKYRSSLLSVEYRRLLERAYERTSKKEDNITNSLAVAKFDKDLDTIDRIRKGEHIEFDGETDKEKRLKLLF